MGGVSVRTEIEESDEMALFNGAFVNRKQLEAEIQQAISKLVYCFISSDQYSDLGVSTIEVLDFYACRSAR